MKISWIRYKEDKENFRFFKGLGFSVYELEDPDKTDEMIKQLIDNQCKTIILTDEVASFSQDIIKKYTKEDEVNIIIAPNKKEEL